MKISRKAESGSRKMYDVIKALSESVTYDFDPKGEGLKNLSGRAIKKIRVDFGQNLDIAALADNKSFSHLYELGHIGTPNMRLFTVEKVNNGVSVRMRPAKHLVPLSKIQKTRGASLDNNGELVRKQDGQRVTKRYLFPARPFMYEFGKRPIIKRKPNTKAMFTYSGRFITKKKIAGFKPRATVGKLRLFSKEYFADRGPVIMNAEAKKYAKSASNRARAAVFRVR